MKTTRKLTLATLGAVAAALLAPYGADSGTCANPAARDLLVASYADTMLNGPKGEDTNFFTKAGGVPNIMVLLDTTGSMNRLPPDGPNNYGTALPPGYYMGGNETASATQTAAFAANETTTTAPKFTDTCKQLATDTCTSDAQCCSGDCTGGRCTPAGPRWVSPATNARIVGCGLDAVSAGNAAFTGSAMYQIISARRFYPPCGNAVDPTLVGAEYKGQAIDYGDQMKVCPYFTSSNNQAVGAPGFDPDYYNATDPTATVSGSKINLFGKNLIFHDNPDMNANWSRSTTLAFGHNFGGGFSYNALTPHLDKASGAKSTIATFCAQQGTLAPQMQGGRSHADICNECLTTRGWYYDGTYFSAGENTAPTPSVWYSGNYLSFFPPKYLIARKVLKDIIAVQSRIRMAMATFSNSGATFIQPFNPTCGMPDTSNFDSNRASYVNSVDGIAFGGGTPLAVSLFDVGRYYHSPDLPWFGTTWESSSKESAGNANQAAICYSCQTSSVILITDGQPSSPDGDSLPANGLTAADLASNKKAGDATTGIRGITKAVCPECDSFVDTSNSAYKDNLAKVAFYMHNMDLRRDAETTLDCKGNGGKQVLDTYTIGFATKGLASVNTILANAAKAGGGMFVPAENTQALKEGFNAIIEEINGRSTSFSIASVSTLQTVSGSAVHVPRFSPSKTALWQGHLFRYDLHAEFVQDCTPNGAGDLNCDGACTAVFLADKDDSLISEDANGAFVKNDPPEQANCQLVPACGTNCAVAGSAPANPYWDAAGAWDGSELPKWQHRNVWTVVDTGDGDLDIEDKMVKFEDTDAAAKDIIPYLALGGGTVCAQVGARFATAGDLTAAALVTTGTNAQLECAKAIIRFVLGADLFNETGQPASAYPPSSPAGYVDRAFLLGDIFHSSPNVVVAPLPSNSDACKQGLVRQCIKSLWETDTPNGLAAYDEFQKTPRYRDRRRIVLVGANDGMLHAFDDGPFVEAKNDWPVQDHTQELWAFIPPDLINKLPTLLGTEHQLFVDGTAMVRDVWVDGDAGNALGKGTLDDRKEATEFHTVAVVGERRGGTRYFALDITDATEPDTVPRFLWLFPQPASRESLTFGETYNDVLPTAPPIGPVRVATGTIYPTFADSPKYKYDGSGTPFHETWVAMLNGGYDPQYVRGRGVHMVDVWTGKELWDFSNPDDSPQSAAAGDPRYNLRFPVPAAVGMLRWGTQEKMPDGFSPPDNYFDTATFGDAGGQLWTLRFHVPARLDGNGFATNWFGGRMFQMGGQVGCKLCGGNPFFYVTANAPTPADRVLHVYAGTGDRITLTDKNGGTCGPNNLRACVMRGCTVNVTQAANLLSAPGPGFAQRGMSEVACADLVNTKLDGVTASCTVNGEARIDISCPGITGNTPKNTAMSCIEAADGSGYQCTQTKNVKGSDLSPAGMPTVGNWFFGLRGFDSASHAIFTTAAQAKTYDANRYWIGQNNAIRSGTASLAMIDSTLLTGNGTEDGPGWAMYYNQPQFIVVDGVTVELNWRDEKTSSGTTVNGDVVSWNTVTVPLSATAGTSTGGGCRVSRCTQEDRRINTTYAANGVSGAALGHVFDNTGNLKRSVSSFRLVPAQAAQTTFFVDKQGKVQKAMVAVSPEQGAMSFAASEPEDPVTEGGMLIIDKGLYQCRYADTPTCK